MYYSNQKRKLSDEEWMESVTGQIGLKVNEGYGEDAMDAKMYFHDKLKEVLAQAAGAFELQGKHDANELNPVNEFLGKLITILPANAGSIKGGIGKLRKEIFDKLKEQQQPQQPQQPQQQQQQQQQQANGQMDTPPPLPAGYGQAAPGKWSPNYR
jgi:hypothetical protein